LRTPAVTFDRAQQVKNDPLVLMLRFQQAIHTPPHPFTGGVLSPFTT
jgi:hypothetical protein